MMKIPACVAVLSIAAASAIAPDALAQTWPAKAVRIISPFPAGGASDVVSRLVAQHLSGALGRPFVVEARPGAGGNVGTDVAAKAPPDGYTLVLSSSGPLANNRFLYKSMPFDGTKDFSYIILIGQMPMVVVANASAAVKTLSDLVALARARPGQLNAGSPGNGTMGHLTQELLKSVAKISLTHVPYKGGASLTGALLAGDIQLSVDVINPWYIKQVQSGAIKGLAVTALSRFPMLPDMPTAIEQGMEALEASTWFALVGPAGLPKPVVEKLNQEVNRYIASPAGRAKLLEIGAQPVGGPPERIAQIIASESPKWKRLIEQSNVRLD
ncbi:MAG: tripartite tricarboxylate transporter substrate binding protein [Betaproteobacteria bacterium]|nr:tripartite tricarboxylate transporter substrate binding protein [Betaproteobacteria bacterium]